MGKMRRELLGLFGGLAVLGVGIAILANLGGMLTLSATGGVYAVLQRHGLETNEVLLGELYDVVLGTDWPWSIALLAGIGVLVLALVGFGLVWRRVR